jgi:hypothetical protein
LDHTFKGNLLCVLLKIGLTLPFFTLYLTSMATPRYHTRLHQRNLPCNTPPTPTEDEDEDPATSSDSEDDKQGNDVLAESDSEEEDEDEEEEEEEPPAKKPSSTKATTKKASSTTGITPKNSKSKTNKGKPAANTPKSVTYIGVGRHEQETR